MTTLTSNIDAERIEFDPTISPDELKQVFIRKFGLSLIAMSENRLYPYTIVTSLGCHAQVCFALGARDEMSRGLIGHISYPGLLLHSPFTQTVSVEADERLRDGVLYVFFGKLEPFRVNVNWPYDETKHLDCFN